MRRNYYYKYDIHRNLFLDLSFFTPFIKAAVSRGEGEYKVSIDKIEGMSRIEWDNFVIEFTYLVIAIRQDRITLYLKWTDEEEGIKEEYSQIIEVIAEPSNLVDGAKVYYFYDFLWKCRRLFYIGNRWESRLSFNHRYRGQTESRKMRVFCHLSSPYRKYGKEYYRGNITPYGKRCLRYEKREKAAWCALIDEWGTT